MHRHSTSVLTVSMSTCLLLSMVACGGGQGNDPTPSPGVAITISPTSATVSAGGTRQFQASVTGSSNTAAQWEVNQVTGGNSQAGTISSSGLYTAPMTTVGLQVTVTTVAAADPSKTANAIVTVNPIWVPPGISVTISPTAATVAVSTNQQFTATVTGTTNPA